MGTGKVRIKEPPINLLNLEKIVFLLKFYHGGLLYFFCQLNVVPSKISSRQSFHRAFFCAEINVCIKVCIKTRPKKARRCDKAHVATKVRNHHIPEALSRQKQVPFSATKKSTTYVMHALMYLKYDKNLLQLLKNLTFHKSKIFRCASIS